MVILLGWPGRDSSCFAGLAPRVCYSILLTHWARESLPALHRQRCRLDTGEAAAGLVDVVNADGTGSEVKGRFVTRLWLFFADFDSATSRRGTIFSGSRDAANSSEFPGHPSVRSIVSSKKASRNSTWSLPEVSGKDRPCEGLMSSCVRSVKVFPRGAEDARPPPCPSGHPPPASEHCRPRPDADNRNGRTGHRALPSGLKRHSLLRFTGCAAEAAQQRRTRRRAARWPESTNGS